MITKNELDKLVKIYEIRSFTESDPSQFLRKYTDEKDIEITSFISAVFAFGKRESFISKLNYIFKIMGESPYNFIINFDVKNNDFKDFVYRFVKEDELIDFILCLQKLYSQNKSLKMLFEYGYKSTGNVKGMLQVVVDYFYSNSVSADNQPLKHLLPNPKKGSAMKRLFMFLRWMVRDGEVDLGLWDFIPKNELLIPMDTHVVQQAKKMGLLNNPKADYKNAVELTNKLKQFDSNDPAKYDFALFGYGIEND